MVVFATIGLIGATVFVLSGLFNVAATEPHSTMTERIIKLTLRRSVSARSASRLGPDLADEGLVRLGAKHFRFGCAPCHGAPGSARDAIAASMYPAPPSLSDATRKWETEELFWIIKHGIKMTGMPAWPGAGRDDEVWPLVAFLQRLPGMESEDYLSMSADAVGGGSTERGPSGHAGDEIVSSCNGCHGGRDSAPVSSLVPSLYGQKAGYLLRALHEYRRNRRQSGIMEPIADRLGDSQLTDLARHYSEGGRQAVQPASGPVSDTDSVLRGREIVEHGAPGGQIPACLACHSAGRSGRFPVLAGLSADYIRNQLRLFQNGVRDQTAYAAVMSVIARRLSSQQIDDAAAFLSSLPPGSATGAP
jgi:cytochrome c553